MKLTSVLYLSLLFIIPFPSLANNCNHHKIEVDIRIITASQNGVAVEIGVVVVDSLTGDTIPHPCPYLETDPTTPSFAYFVEFGDGRHIYTYNSTISYIYTTWSEKSPYIRVKVNYIYGDDGEPPALTIPLPGEITSSLPKNVKLISNFIEGMNSEVKFDFDASPTIGRTMTTFINYWAKPGLIPNGIDSVEGKVRFYYNDSQNAPNGFSYVDQSSRLFHLDSFVIDKAVSTNDPNYGTYKRVIVWAFTDFEPSEFRSIFFDFRGLPNLEAEPSRFLAFKVELEIDSLPGIQATAANSHPLLIARDPNKMTAYQLKIENEDRYLEYEVQFQNTGESFEDSITIDLDLDPHLIIDSISMISCSPARRSPTRSLEPVLLFIKDTVRIVLDSIRLPGLNQIVPGSSAMKYQPNRTIGFVKFKIFHKADSVLKEYEIRNKAYLRFGRLDTTIVTNIAINEVSNNKVGLPCNWAFAGRFGVKLPFQHRNFKIGQVNPFAFQNTLIGVVATQKPESPGKPYFRAELTLYSLNYKDPAAEELDLLFLELSGQLRLNFTAHWSAGLGVNFNTLLSAESNSEKVSDYNKIKLGVLGDILYSFNEKFGMGGRINAYYSPKLFESKSAFFPVGEVYFQYDIVRY